MSIVSRFRCGPSADSAPARRIPAGAAAAALLVAIIAGATAGPLAAQADTPADSSLQVGTRSGASAPLVATRLSSPIRLDGRVDEAAWMAIEPIRAVMSSPTFGVEPSERTEFRIAYDESYLYISGVLHDREPDGIRATTLRRDDTSLSNDWFAVTIDGYRDRENALVFGVTPAGVRTDLEAPNDAEGSLNFAWNAFWDAEVTRTETGWSAEIRIPFTSLPYQPDEAGRVVMGITIWRNIARKNELISWPAIEPLWSSSMLKASQTGDVVLQGLSRRRVVYTTPYLLAGASRTPILPAGAPRWTDASDGVGEAGLDVKVGITANLTLDLTVNTDFAQVEADDQAVNLTRFSLFFPERRLFFQERAGIFAFETGDSDRLFYSRRIGLVNGQPARIYGGARIVGRVGEWDVGLLNMQTAAAGDATQNVGTLRLRRRLHNASSYAGGMLTTLVGEDGRHNVAAGVDLALNLSGQNFLSVNLAQTWSDQDPSGVELADRGLGRVRLERRGLDGFGMDLAASRVGGRYDPALGFLQRRDFTRFGDAVGWGWRAGKDSPVLRHRLALRGRSYFQNEGFTLESLEAGPEWSLEMKSGRWWVASTSLREERVAQPFAFAGASVPAGDYRWVEGRLAHTQPGGALLRGTLAVEGGRFYDGYRLGFSAGPTWSASRHLELNGLYQASRITFAERPSGEEQVLIQVARIRARVMLSGALSTAFFVQYTSAADLVTLNARLRYNRREGQDFYLVFNDGLNTERAAFEPGLPLSAGRTLLLKYSHAVLFGW
ncbi:MAG: carbohydrate binding family 9 domain-containing protein [Gemmatimonadetes bacterium]|nr:carbohydrate binding family 9 domain-containing protein [Gemmatimonadota bacterium]